MAKVPPASATLPPVKDPAIGETLVGADELQARVAELGAEISRDYADRDLVMIGILKGRCCSSPT